MSPAASSALSPVKAERLYWLGRYVQRAIAGSPTDPDLTNASEEGSLAFNVTRAYENGFLLRDILDNDVFAYLRLAMTKVEALSPGDYLGVREVRDQLYAFWGILEEALSPEIEAFCRWGRFLELAEARTPEGALIDDASWKNLAWCWSVLGTGEPGRTVPEVEQWFGRPWRAP